MLDTINIITHTLEHHPIKRYGTRSIDDIDKIIIHHSGTKNGRAASYARYHVNNKGWPGIGYHMVSDADGINMTNDFTAISYHTSGKNTNSIGVCQTGNFDLIAPTEQQYWNWIQMVIHIDKLLGIQLPVHYHSEYSQKECPGKLFDRAFFEKELKQCRYIFEET